MKLIDYRRIAPTLNAELKAVLAKYGLEAGKINATVEESLGIVRIKLECVDQNLKAADGSATNPDREMWKRYAEMLNLKPEWLDQEVAFGSESFKVVGLQMPSRGAAKVVVERLSDKAVRLAKVENFKQVMNRRAA